MALVSYFIKFEDFEPVLPVIFYQLVLRVCELYSSMGKSCILFDFFLISKVVWMKCRKLH